MQLQPVPGRRIADDEQRCVRAALGDELAKPAQYVIDVTLRSGEKRKCSMSSRATAAKVHELEAVTLAIAG